MTKLAAVLVGIGLVAVVPAGAADRDASKVTMKAVRDSGTAMYSWLADQRPGRPLDEDAGAALAAAPNPFPWGSCPVTSADDLSKLLVPKYIPELPRKDGWGHDLQFCLQLDEAEASRFILGVRSPGSDGTFTTAAYDDGAFPVADADRDIVWMNGVFVCWPQ